MSKYIIEIEEKPLCVFDKDTQTFFPRLWRVKGFNSLVFDEEGLSRLEELNSDYINEHFGDLQDTAYQKGFEDGKKEAESSDYIKNVEMDAFNKGMLFKEEKINDAFKRGFEKGKAVNDKGCEGCKYANVAGTHEPCVRCSNSYDNQWMARDGKIEVGDEVKSLSDSGVEIEGLLPWVVTTVDQGDYCQGIDSKGEVHATKKVRACKTGRHFDIAKILEAMKA